MNSNTIELFNNDVVIGLLSFCIAANAIARQAVMEFAMMCDYDQSVQSASVQRSYELMAIKFGEHILSIGDRND